MWEEPITKPQAKNKIDRSKDSEQEQPQTKKLTRKNEHQIESQEVLEDENTQNKDAVTVEDWDIEIRN